MKRRGAISLRSLTPIVILIAGLGKDGGRGWAASTVGFKAFQTIKVLLRGTTTRGTSLGSRRLESLGDDVLASVGLQPHPDHEWGGAVGQFLTFVVPAPSGCNLRCSACLVRQRQEITDTRLGPEDLARFIREAAQRAPIFALAIQGYEPLLPESLPYTQAILATGRFLNVPTTLVTNGTGLGGAVGLLKTLSPTQIAISLDAASADIHDRIRGVAGAWAATVAGVERAAEVLEPQTLVVSSVLIPSKRQYLDDMPARLRDMGIDRWIVNPLLRVGRGEDVGGPAGDQTTLFRDLLTLHQTADRDGVRLTVDDEFGHLNYEAACARQPALRALHVRTLPPNVELFRLTPGGQCSTGGDVLQQVNSDTPVWQPRAMHAGDFLAMLSSHTQTAAIPQ